MTTAPWNSSQPISHEVMPAGNHCSSGSNDDPKVLKIILIFIIFILVILVVELANVYAVHEPVLAELLFSSWGGIIRQGEMSIGIGKLFPTVGAAGIVHGERFPGACKADAV
jgi:hypothetical protein